MFSRFFGQNRGVFRGVFSCFRGVFSGVFLFFGLFWQMRALCFMASSRSSPPGRSKPAEEPGRSSGEDD